MFVITISRDSFRRFLEGSGTCSRASFTGLGMLPTFPLSAQRRGLLGGMGVGGGNAYICIYIIFSASVAILAQAILAQVP